MGDAIGTTLKKAAPGRMREWRERQRQRLGGLVQIATWVRADQEKRLRAVFELLADPDWTGDAYRALAVRWLARRRPPGRTFAGRASSSEIDGVMLNDGVRVRPIGGRIFGADGALVELTPEEAAELEAKARAALDEVHEAFLRSRGLIGTVRDTTGVIVDEHASHLRDLDGGARSYEVDRPSGDAEFWASERAIVRSALSFEQGSLIDLGKECHVYSYAGRNGYPSRCLVVTSLESPEVQPAPDEALVALVKLKHGGTPPSLCFASLAGALQDKLLPRHDATKIHWYDAEELWSADASSLRITRVMMRREDGAYADPVWRYDAERNQRFNRLIRQTLLDYDQQRCRAQHDGVAEQADDLNGDPEAELAARASER